MTKSENADLLERELRQVSPEIRAVYPLGEVDGVQTFALNLARLLTTDEVVALCRLLATAIRGKFPDKPDWWAAAIRVWQHGASLSQPMGIYFAGWAGQADRWLLYEGQDRSATYRTEWLALRERLRDVLSTFGTEGNANRGNGDFSLMTSETFPREQAVYLHRPEFLTRELISMIQGALREGYADWLVDVVLGFPPPLDVLLRGIIIRVDSVEEIWDRREVEELLGDRLKI